MQRCKSVDESTFENDSLVAAESRGPSPDLRIDDNDDQNSIYSNEEENPEMETEAEGQEEEKGFEETTANGQGQKTFIRGSTKNVKGRTVNKTGSLKDKLSILKPVIDKKKKQPKTNAEK